MSGYTAVIMIKTKSHEEPIVYNFYKNDWNKIRDLVNQKMIEYSEVDDETEVIQFIVSNVYVGHDTKKKVVASKSWNPKNSETSHWKIFK